MRIELIAEIIVLSESNKEIDGTDTLTDEEIHELRREYSETLQREGYIVKETYATYRGIFYSD